MGGIARILLATDFGAPAKVAEGDAALLSRAFRVPVDLVHVHASAPHTRLSAEALAQRTEARIAECRAALRALGAESGRDHVTTGSAAEAILHTAEAVDAGLVVIGGGEQPHEVTGTTAETVARFARAPVWVSRRRAQPELQRILVAADHSESALAAYRAAHDLARRVAAQIVVVHVREHEAGESAEALAEFLSAASAGAKPELLVERGRASEALAKSVLDTGADLLVMGRVGLSGLRRVFLGGTAERLLRRCRCSLLLTSPSGAST